MPRCQTGVGTMNRAAEKGVLKVPLFNGSLIAAKIQADFDIISKDNLFSQILLLQETPPLCPIAAKYRNLSNKRQPYFVLRS